MKKAEKLEMIHTITNAIKFMPDSHWGKSGYDETAMQVAMIHAYNIKDILYFHCLREKIDNPFERMKGYDILQFIFKNIKYFNSSQRYSTGCGADCTGQLCGESMTVKRHDNYSAFVILTATFDY